MDDSDDIRDPEWRINLEKIVDCGPMRVMEYVATGFAIPGSVFHPLPASAFDKPRNATDDAAVALTQFLYIYILYSFFSFFKNVFLQTSSQSRRYISMLITVSVVRKRCHNYFSLIHK